MKLRLFTRSRLLGTALAALALMAGTGHATTIKGVVEDGDEVKIAGATVWLIPATDVAAMAKTPIQIKSNATNDEPLEDNLAANRGTYLKAQTDKNGKFTVAAVPEARFFLYVEPTNNRYLPGGDKTRKALSAKELAAEPITIKVSGNTPPKAHYVGTSKCLKCHDDQEDFPSTLHRLGIRVIGSESELQDYSKFPDFNKGLDELMAGKKFWLYDFDNKRSFDKYKISDKAPAAGSKVSFTASFFTDKDGKLKFRTENAKDSADPARTYTVERVYGGGLYKQRYVYRVGQNLFPFVQRNYKGDDSYASRTRKQWRDYHGNWLFSEKTAKLTDPPAKKSFDKNCASCHYNGYTVAKAANGDYIAGSVNDKHGELDIDGDGKPNELNLGCEVCHGPGSVHAKSEDYVDIVSPDKLAPERVVVICAQCHTRPKGNLGNDQPVNKDHRMMRPGTSRNTYLTEYTVRPDAAAKSFWPDGLHSKSHHQQDTDFVKSAHYRNGDQLLTCANCHDTHGGAKFEHQLRKDPKSAEICTSCHEDTTDMKQHVTETTKCTVAPDKITCTSCHDTKTMQSGAGMGKGMMGKNGQNYWVNDITSHIYDVPRKDNVGVKGVDPGKAMPIPYTNACGAACHDTTNL